MGWKVYDIRILQGNWKVIATDFVRAPYLLPMQRRQPYVESFEACVLSAYLVKKFRIFKVTMTP